MGRQLKRVPLDFQWPLGLIWCGYDYSPCKRTFDGTPTTEEQHDYAYQYWYDHHRKDPPAGDGFQLWENTSEGSPLSPVFDTLEKLCEYCAEHVPTFASFRASAEEWRGMLDRGWVGHTETKDGVTRHFC